MKKISSVLISLLLIAALLTFAGCGKIAEKHDPNLDVLDYALVAADAAALQELDVYVNLQTLDLRGSDCYDAIESYIDSHPQVKVTYDVAVAGTRYSPNVELLTLEDGTYELEELLSVMKHLPRLAGLDLPKTNLTVAELDAIREAYPNLDISYTLELLGEEMTPLGLEGLYFSNLTPAEVDENLLEKLQLLPELRWIELMDTQGNSNFTPADVKNLMDVLPGVMLNYRFELFGQIVTTADERVEFKKVPIGNEGIPEIRAALDILPNCTYFLMDTCGVDNEVMAQLRDDYPNTKVVWRVFWNKKYHALTDVEMINANRVSTDEVQVLKYCTDVKYLDVGHSSNLRSIEFTRYMPKLKICIIVDSGVESLEPLANCPDLEWLEIVFCRKITDLSPLTNCKKLRGVNMSTAYGIRDLSPLFELENMERLYLGKSSVKMDMYRKAVEEMPNCWVTRSNKEVSGISGNYAVGWRLDSGGTLSQWYLEIRDIFRYKENYYSGKYE